MAEPLPFGEEDFIPIVVDQVSRGYTRRHVYPKPDDLT